MSQKPFRLRFNFWLNLDKPEEEEIADQIEILKNERSFTQTIRDGIRLVSDLRQGRLDVLFELFPWVRAEFLEHLRDVKSAPDNSAEQDRQDNHQDISQQTNKHEIEQGIKTEWQRIESERQWLESEAERLESERKWHEKQLEAQRKMLEEQQAKQNIAIHKQLSRLETLLLDSGHKIVNRVGDIPDGLHTIAMEPVAGGPTKMSVPQLNMPDYDDDDMLLEVTVDNEAGIRASQNFLDSLMRLQE